MLSSLIAIKLLDGTLIYAREHLIEDGRIRAKNIKFMKEGETPTYIDDEMAISNDAVDVWFRILEGGSPRKIEKPTGPFAPKINPAA